MALCLMFALLSYLFVYALWQRHAYWTMRVKELHKRYEHLPSAELEAEWERKVMETVCLGQVQDG